MKEVDVKREIYKRYAFMKPMKCPKKYCYVFDRKTREFKHKCFFYAGYDMSSPGKVYCRFKNSIDFILSD